MNKMTGLLLALSIAMALALSADDHGLWQPKKKKLIDLSWSNPTVEFLAEHVREMEESTPLDGLTVRFNPVSPTGTRSGSAAMSKDPWEYEWFAKSIELYKRITFEKFTDNFYYTVVSPGNADWFNDADWSAVCNNYGIAARIAKETGMRGILLDIEEYATRFWDFSTIKTGQTYDEAYRIARRRGQEWGRAVFGAYPEIAILALHMMSYGNASSSLTVPFFNGVFEVIPATATLHDGLEGASYSAKKNNDYSLMLVDLALTFLPRVESANYAKYRTQVKLAPGYYLDGMYTAAPDSTWRQRLMPELGQDPLGFFRNNLMSGMKVADEFVWIYGELGSWWKGSPHPRAQRVWEEIRPGITETVLVVRDPSSLNFAAMTNLLKNPEFQERAADVVVGWNFWQLEQEKKDWQGPLPGKAYWEDGCLKIRGATNGCWTQNVAVEPGKTYIMRITARMETPINGAFSGSVAFQNENKKWNNYNQRQTMYFPKDDTGEWFTRVIQFTVPDDSYFVSFQLGASNLGKDGIVAFKEAAFYKF